MALKLQLKRNKELFENKEAAIEGLSAALANGNAGEIMIATYKWEDPYMYEIPLYDTDGGDTYIDWLNKNKGYGPALLLDTGDVITMQFSGHLQVQGWDEISSDGYYPLLGFSESCSMLWLRVCGEGFASTMNVTELLHANATITVGEVAPDGKYDLTLNARFVKEDGTSWEQEKDSWSKYISVLGQLRYDGNASNISERISSFKMTYIPSEPILKENLYKDEFNYSDIQLG